MKKIFLLTLVYCFCTSLIAQKTITGTVKDGSDNSLLAGVSVAVKGASRGTVTDVNGQFTLPVQSGDKDLVFSFLGMKTQTVPIGDKNSMTVVMSTDEKVLNEVVVTALGISRPERSLSFSQQGVDAAKMAEVKDQNIVSSLAGKVAGVMVTPPPSSTGSARIVIRGNTSFTGNNQPLFIIDGMQIDNSDGSTSVNKNGGLDFGNGASDLNSDDIESITVLKGPNAAALYGSNAANGAVIITTKKAKDGRFKVSVSSNGMYHYISQWPEFQNAFGVGHMTQMVGGNSSVLLTTDPNGNPYPYPGIPSMANIMNTISNRSNGAPQIGQPYIGLDGQMHSYLPQPDNVYGFYQTAYAYTNNIAVEGGNTNNNYRVSLTNNSANDVVEKQNMVNRNTLTMRFFNTLVKHLTLDSKLTITDDDTKNRRYSNQDNYNPLYMYTIMPRTMTLDQLQNYKTDGGTELITLGGIHNPYWTINETHNEDIRTRLLANFDLAYQILPSLKATVKYAREFINLSKNEFKNSGALGTPDLLGYYSESLNKTNNETYEWQLIYNDRLFRDLSIFAMVGGSQQNWYNYWNSAYLQSLKQAGFANISNSNDPPIADEGTYNKRRNSLYGSASFGYKDYVYLDLTGRNDWSSTLPPANNSYFYPSVGLSIIPTEFFKIPDRIAYGKLRASFAQVGNDTDPYRLTNYYNMTSTNTYNGYKYVSIDGTLANANLKPETTRSIEFGADLRFLNGRINADVTYYKSNSFDQIIQASMASSSGYSQKMYNAGEIQNQGWEVALRFIPISLKQFTWNFDVNFTHNESMVKSMIAGLDEIQIGEVFSLLEKVKVGYPYGALFGTKWLTDNQGRRMVDPTTGNPVLDPTPGGVYLGNFNPQYLLSFGNTFKYKDFDLYVLVDTRKGGKLYSGTYRQAVRNGVISGFEQDQESYWKRATIMGDVGGNYIWGGTLFKPGTNNNVTNQNIYFYNQAMYVPGTMTPIDPNYVPQQCNYYFWPGNVGYYTDSYDNLIMYDASFVKLREISLGYNLPKKLIANAKMSNARISLVGRNLWIFYQKTPKGLDPEAALNAGNDQGLESGSLPPVTTLGFDVKISF